MALNLATLNVRGLRDPGKCTRLLGEIKTLGVDVAAVQETHFTCGADCRVLESDFNVFSAYGSRTSVGVSLLVGRSLDADVDVVFAGDGGRLVVADVTVKSFKFRLVAVYAPNIVVERVSFFRRLAPFLDDTKRLVLMGDWNAILDPKIDKVGRGARRVGRCESSLAGLMTRHDLVDRFRLDHPGQEMWTWLDSSPSAKVGSYLDRVLVRRADIDFVSCPTFHLIAWTDHKLVRVSLRLANRPREFRSYLADFPHLGVAEAASCEGVVTECEVRDALKQVGLNKSPGLDGLPYEVYLRMSHMFVLILTDMFNHWFAQGAIPGSVTRGVITLLKKGGRHVWEGLDDYRPITLLNTELKILARVFDKSEGLRLGAWRGSNTLPGPFRWSDGPVRILGVWFGPGLQLERNWSEIQAKVNAQVGIWLSRRLSLKGRAEACAVYVFPLILYRLAVLPLPKVNRLALQRSLSRLLWGGARPMVRRQVCIQRTRNGGLGMPDLESHWLAERLAYLGRALTWDAVWRLKASRTFPRLKSDPKAEGRHRPLGETLFFRE